MTREWDAAAYERLSAPQTRWGRIVVDRLELGGNERVLDAGCGTGRVTAMLLERLPEGHVLCLDGSAAMIEQASVRFAGEPRVELIVADLTEYLRCPKETSRRSWRPCASAGSSTGWPRKNASASSTRSHAGCRNR